ncbi:MAG: pitrilysin family protein [Pseudomonadota bacterium]
MIARLTALVTLFALPAWAEVDIQEVTSPGGIDAWLVEESSIPFTALELRFDGGASLDPEGLRGATNLMMGMLEEGSGDMDARAFAEARETLAARFDFEAYGDSVSISASFLSENRDEAVALLRQALTQPTFDEVAVARVKRQVLSGIRSDALDPDEISSTRFYEMAFGDHPYGSDLAGTEESVAAITRADLETARQNALALDRLHVGAVGDITAEELGLLLDELLGDLPASGPALPPRVDFTLPGGTTVVDFEGPQSTALFGHVGIERDDPRYFAAFILMEILGGGGIESRLGFEVREERGLTYGISAFIVPRDLSEMILGRVRSSNETIAEAIEVTRDVWERTATEGVTPEELARTQTYLTGAYPLRFDGNGRIANILAGMQQADLGIDYIATRNANIEAVTLEEVNRVAREILLPDALHFVVVGEPVGLSTTTN